MEHTRLDIVTLINNSPINKLSDQYQVKLLEKVKANFTDDQQQLFLASFFCYLNHDTKNDFVIDLDDIWKWCGFARKDPAKRVIEKNFTKDIDYRVIPSIPHVGGGSSKETIILTINTFKKFCLKAGTKKADDIHDYYIKLEELLQETLNDELIENKILLQNTQNALQAEREKIKSITRKRYYNQEKGDTIYIYENNSEEENSYIRVGKSKNLSGREGNYNTHNKSGRIIYAKKCYNSDLLEKLIHQFLDKYRILPNQEWFDCSFEIAKEAIDCCQLILDEFMPYTDALSNYKMSSNLKEMLDEIKELSENKNEHDQTIRKTNNIYQVANSINEKAEQDAIQNLPKHIEVKNPLDFSRFISEACEVDPEFVCLKVDLYGAHKLWGRNRSFGGKTPNHVLNKHFSEHFVSSNKFYEEYNSTLAIFQGIRPKTFLFKPTHENSVVDFETFIIEQCKIGFTYRASYKSLINEFEIWKAKRSDLEEYNIELQEKRKFQDYLNSIFYPGGVFLSDDVKGLEGGGANSQGVWGITLNEDNSNVGLKISAKLKKKVLQINVESKIIVNTFDSVSETAKYFNIGSSAISTDIRFERVRNGCILRFVNPCN